MRTEDLEIINEVGRALYSDADVAQVRSVETVAALSTLSTLSETQTFERALLALLSRAESEGMQSIAEGISLPFYRLSPTERFVLALLHSGKISYRRLSQLLKLSGEDLQALAWHARVKLASQPEVRLKAPHPVGSSGLKQPCPEYDASKPWTQRFLDDEMGRQEVLMIQNHTAACPSCQRALAQAREFYYAVESQIPGASVSGEAVAESLRRARLKLGTDLPADLTVMEGLRIFFSRKEIQFYLGLLAIGVLYLILRN